MFDETESAALIGVGGGEGGDDGEDGRDTPPGPNSLCGRMQVTLSKLLSSVVGVGTGDGEGNDKSQQAMHSETFLRRSTAFILRVDLPDREISW